MGELPSGRDPSNRPQITVATHTKKNVPEYNVKVTLDSPAKKPAQSVIEFNRPFANWFDAEGHFVTIPFQEMLATAIPSVGKLDTRRVKPVEAESQYSDQVLEAVLAASSASATGSAVGAEAVAAKASKRRKA